MLVLLLVATLSGAGAARSQSLFDRNENISVRDRPRPEYEALGVPAGGFTLYPKLTLGVAENENLLATSAAAAADTVFAVEPQLTLKSNWNQNALMLTADATLDRHVRDGTEDSDQYAFTAAGTLNIRRDLTVTTEASFQRILLPRTSDAYFVFSATPLLYDQTEAKFDVVKEFSRVKITAQGQFQHFNYENGVGLFLLPLGSVPPVSLSPIDEHFRDRITFHGDLRGDYAFSPEFALFLEGAATHSEYDTASRRNGDVVEALAGPNFEISHLLTGELGVGYLVSSFNAPHDKTTGTLHLRAKVEYFPTQLITVTLKAQQGVVDSGVPASPAYLARRVELQADYELLRNLILTLRASDDWDDYREIDRRDNHVDGRFSATYLANRWLGVTLAYDRGQRWTHGTAQVRLVNGFIAGLNQRFTDDVVSLSLTLQR